MRLKVEGDVNFDGADKKTFRKELVAAARWFDIDHTGLPVTYKEPASNTRRRGSCRYKGNGEIILYDHGRDLKAKIKTFVHELKHLDDYRNYRMKGKKEPRGREKRARIWANDWEADRGLQQS